MCPQSRQVEVGLPPKRARSAALPNCGRHRLEIHAVRFATQNVVPNGTGRAADAQNSGARLRAAARRGRRLGAAPTRFTARNSPRSVLQQPATSQRAVATRSASSHCRRVRDETDTTSKPPLRTSGRPHSASSATGPNSRATAPSKASRVCGDLANAAMRACRTSTRSWSPAAAAALEASSQRRRRASTSVQCDEGSSSANSTPGMPAPVPKSTSLKPSERRQAVSSPRSATRPGTNPSACR